MAGCSPLTVARQLRIPTGFPVAGARSGKSATPTRRGATDSQGSPSSRPAVLQGTYSASCSPRQPSNEVSRHVDRHTDPQHPLAPLIPSLHSSPRGTNTHGSDTQPTSLAASATTGTEVHPTATTHRAGHDRGRPPDWCVRRRVHRHPRGHSVAQHQCVALDDDAVGHLSLQRERDPRGRRERRPRSAGERRTVSDCPVTEPIRTVGSAPCRPSLCRPRDRHRRLTPASPNVGTKSRPGIVQNELPHVQRLHACRAALIQPTPTRTELRAALVAQHPPHPRAGASKAPARPMAGQ